MSSKKVIPLTHVPTRAEIELLVTKARELAAKSPAKAATILTDWMKRASGIRKKAG